MEARKTRAYVKFSDRIGTKYGCLKVLGLVSRSGCNYLARVLCDCGKESDFWLNRLHREGDPVDCIHCRPVLEEWQIAIRGIWYGIVRRCHVESDQAYPSYGGRGIAVCDRWRNSFLAFCEDMGPRPPRTSIERIDNNGHYSPENCRWANRADQARNKRNSKRFTVCGRTMISSDWADLCGITRERMRQRFDKYSPEEAVLVYESAAVALGVPSVEFSWKSRLSSASASLVNSPVKAVRTPGKCTICDCDEVSLGLCSAHYFAFNRLKKESPSLAEKVALQGKVIRGKRGRKKKVRQQQSSGWGPY